MMEEAQSTPGLGLTGRTGCSQEAFHLMGNSPTSTPEPQQQSNPTTSPVDCLQTPELHAAAAHPWPGAAKAEATGASFLHKERHDPDASSCHPGLRSPRELLLARGSERPLQDGDSSQANTQGTREPDPSAKVLGPTLKTDRARPASSAGATPLESWVTGTGRGSAAHRPQGPASPSEATICTGSAANITVRQLTHRAVLPPEGWPRTRENHTWWDQPLELILFLNYYIGYYEDRKT